MKHDIFINGYIGEMFDLFGDGNSYSLKSLNNDLANLPQNTTELVIHINSGGGLVSEGFAIYDTLITQPLPVTTIVEGMCGSIATIIAQAGKKGARKMFQNSDYFIHNPLWIPSAPDAHNADDLEKLTEELRKNEEKILDFYVKSTGADRNVLSEKMKAESTLTSAEAKQLGFIDEVINTDVVAMVKYKIAAAVKLETKQKTNIMADLSKEIQAGFSKLENLFSKLIKKQFVNVKTSDGADVFYDGELKQDGKLFSDETLSTPVADGTYTIENKVYTVAGGVITNIAEVQAQKTELEIANEKIADLTAQLEAKNTEVINAKKEAEETLATATELEKEFVALKSKIETGNGQKFQANAGKPEPTAPKDWKTAVIELRNKK